MKLSAFNLLIFKGKSDHFKLAQVRRVDLKRKKQLVLKLDKIFNMK